LLRHCRFFANVVYEEDTVEKEDKDDEEEEDDEEEAEEDDEEDEDDYDTSLEEIFLDNEFCIHDDVHDKFKRLENFP
jgi:TATA-binding protein-associated factor Taf7